MTELGNNGDRILQYETKSTEQFVDFNACVNYCKKTGINTSVGTKQKIENSRSVIYDCKEL
jgi:hypothetical protein